MHPIARFPGRLVALQGATMRFCRALPGKPEATSPAKGFGVEKKENPDARFASGLKGGCYVGLSVNLS